MIFYFWDKKNDELEILAEDGEFYFYSEDSVMIERSAGETGRYWTRLEKLTDRTPLNTFSNFDILDPETGEWVGYEKAPIDLCRCVQQHAGVKEWWTVT